MYSLIIKDLKQTKIALKNTIIQDTKVYSKVVLHSILCLSNLWTKEDIAIYIAKYENLVSEIQNLSEMNKNKCNELYNEFMKIYDKKL